MERENLSSSQNAQGRDYLQKLLKCYSEEFKIISDVSETMDLNALFKLFILDFQSHQRLLRHVFLPAIESRTV